MKYHIASLSLFPGNLKFKAIIKLDKYGLFEIAFSTEHRFYDSKKIPHFKLLKEIKLN